MVIYGDKGILFAETAMQNIPQRRIIHAWLAKFAG